MRLIFENAVKVFNDLLWKFYKNCKNSIKKVLWKIYKNFHIFLNFWNFYSNSIYWKMFAIPSSSSFLLKIFISPRLQLVTQPKPWKIWQPLVRNVLLNMAWLQLSSLNTRKGCTRQKDQLWVDPPLPTQMNKYLHLKIKKLIKKILAVLYSMHLHSPGTFRWNHWL